MTNIVIDKVVNDSGLTELHLGAYYQEIDWVRNCIEAGFNINKVDYNNYTALIWAIDMFCNSEIGIAEKIIDYLIEQGACIDILPHGYSSILDFAKERKPRIFDYLNNKLKNLIISLGDIDIYSVSHLNEVRYGFSVLVSC